MYLSKVYLSKVYVCEMYTTCVSSKLCEFIYFVVYHVCVDRTGGKALKDSMFFFSFKKVIVQK